MNEIDSMKYYIASEKMGNLINTMDQTLEYMEEFGIKPEEDVKMAIAPSIKRLREWLKQ